VTGIEIDVANGKQHRTSTTSSPAWTTPETNRKIA
jgi:hypothetical protein